MQSGKSETSNEHQNPFFVEKHNFMQPGKHCENHLVLAALCHVDLEHWLLYVMLISSIGCSLPYWSRALAARCHVDLEHWLLYLRDHAERNQFMLYLFNSCGCGWIRVRHYNTLKFITAMNPPSVASPERVYRRRGWVKRHTWNCSGTAISGWKHGHGESHDK